MLVQKQPDHPVIDRIGFWIDYHRYGVTMPLREE
jgi:hypothetical protein